MKSFEIEMTGLDERAMGGRDGLSLVGERPAAHRVVGLPLFFFQSMDLNIYALP